MITDHRERKETYLVEMRICPGTGGFESMVHGKNILMEGEMMDFGGMPGLSFMKVDTIWGCFTQCKIKIFAKT